MKLSPNVTDITEMAKAAEAAGADALSMINTITGMKIDIHRRKFALANKTGGMSGPAIKPVAVRMVYQAARAVKIPIIGMGGIANGEDAVEFLLAGATAVSVGAMNFVNPYTTVEVVQGIERYMERYHVERVADHDTHGFHCTCADPDLHGQLHGINGHPAARLQLFQKNMRFGGEIDILNAVHM